MFDAYGRVDAVWLRLRGACRIAPLSRSWDSPDRWLRGMGLDPARLSPSDAECACIAMERELQRLRWLPQVPPEAL